MFRVLKKGIVLSLILAFSITLIGCGQKESKNDNKIIIGVSPTPHEEIIKNLLPEFEKAGLEVEIKVFNDYVQPNIALNDGDIDANYFQHQPYLDTFNKDHGYNLISIGAIHLEPLGVYSTKIKSLDELKDGDEVVIPNDPTNGARALILLEENGVIKLKNKGDIKSTEKDIVENPKNLKITAMDAATVPNAYKDATIGVINSNFALGAGIDPTTAIVKEKGEGNQYSNIVAIKPENKDKEKFNKFISILKSQKTKEYIEKEFKGAVIPAF